jgi:hypothetical protein
MVLRRRGLYPRAFARNLRTYNSLQVSVIKKMNKLSLKRF